MDEGYAQRQLVLVSDVGSFRGTAEETETGFFSKAVILLGSLGKMDRLERLFRICLGTARLSGFA